VDVHRIGGVYPGHGPPWGFGPFGLISCANCNYARPTTSKGWLSAGAQWRPGESSVCLFGLEARERGSGLDNESTAALPRSKGHKLIPIVRFTCIGATKRNGPAIGKPSDACGLRSCRR
jgi:hypothetical protein